MPPLFVYGSLKQGFPNFPVNPGRRVAGDFKTLLRHPFFLIRGQLPCLLPADGSGFQVLGQHIGPIEVYTLSHARGLHW